MASRHSFLRPGFHTSSAAALRGSAATRSTRSSSGTSVSGACGAAAPSTAASAARAASATASDLAAGKGGSAAGAPAAQPTIWATTALTAVELAYGHGLNRQRIHQDYARLLQGPRGTLLSVKNLGLWRVWQQASR